MSVPLHFLQRLMLPLLLAAAASGAAAQGAAPATRAVPSTPQPRTADYIVAVVNNELVTQFEVEQRLARVRENAARNGTKLPPPAELRRQITRALIDERVLITYARDSGSKVDEAELDRAVANVASMNQLTPEKLRERLKADGIDYTRFRSGLRDQILVERVREREVNGRIRVTDAEIDRYLEQQRTNRKTTQELNIAQVLVTVPEGASPEVVEQRRARVMEALGRIRSGEPFDRVAREMSEDSNRQRGGEMGSRMIDKLPDLFVEAVRPLQPGQVTEQPVQSGAGFHILKLLARGESSVIQVTQTRVRHILLRPSARMSAEAAQARMAELRRQIDAGARFEDLARQYSEDGSAQQGGDLGWQSPGNLVPEFETAMNALPLGGVSTPVVSRFGVHLIQVVDRRETAVDPRQAREQARNALRSQKFDAAFDEWANELRARAYIEMREAPQ